MAERPVFIPENSLDEPRIIIKNINFTWFPGKTKQQKQKSIQSLHSCANREGVKSILEISSKSESPLGVLLSAFNLTITTQRHKKSFSVETAFQGSKVFENGGPYLDLLKSSSLQAKRDIRLKRSGNLVKFIFFDHEFSLKPRTFFYDWLYINALAQNKNLATHLIKYEGC